MLKLKSLRIPIILVVILLTALTAAAFAFAADPMPGAIWTTDYLGHVVNGNVIYESKPDVYLNGGPDKSGKLPDGMYYIQVTEPDGTLLGTTVGGKWGPQTYEVKNGEFVNGLIQLFQATRFKTTTNPGGEYKVWVSTDPKFPSFLAKTDNFKVKKQYWGTLIVRKFNDLDNSGTWNSTNEPLIPGWKVTIKNLTDPDNPDSIWHQELYNGEFQSLVVPGTYEITEETRDGWKATTPVTQIVVVPPKETGKAEFGNRQLAWLDIQKFYDFNRDKIRQDNEQLLPGWKVNLTGTNAFGKQVSMDIMLADGTWSDWIDPGDYTVTEYLPSDPKWVNTTDLSFKVILEPGGDAKVAFGNVYLGFGGGHTHGFWGNKNGQAQFETDTVKYLSALNSLYLVNEVGTLKTPFKDYDSYAVWNGHDVNAVNMAYMLSVQLAAMKLNVTAGPAQGFVNGNCYLYVSSAYEIKLNGSVVNANGFITVNDLITAADNALRTNQLTTEGSPDRDYQAFLKNALDSANNNQNFVQEIPPKGPYF